MRFEPMCNIYHGNFIGYSQKNNTILLEDVCKLNGDNYEKGILVNIDNVENLPSNLMYNQMIYFEYDGEDRIKIKNPHF